MLEIKDFGMFGQGRTFEVNVRFGRTEQFGLKMAELFGRTECSFEHQLKPTAPLKSIGKSGNTQFIFGLAKSINSVFLAAEGCPDTTNIFVTAIIVFRNQNSEYF